MGFKEVKVEELPFKPFTKIGSEWMLITAGTEETVRELSERISLGTKNQRGYANQGSKQRVIVFSVKNTKGYCD